MFRAAGFHSSPLEKTQNFKLFSRCQQFFPGPLIPIPLGGSLTTVAVKLLIILSFRGLPSIVFVHEEIVSFLHDSKTSGTNVINCRKTRKHLTRYHHKHKHWTWQKKSVRPFLQLSNNSNDKQSSNVQRLPSAVRSQQKNFFFPSAREKQLLGRLQSTVIKGKAKRASDDGKKVR